MTNVRNASRSLAVFDCAARSENRALAGALLHSQHTGGGIGLVILRYGSERTAFTWGIKAVFINADGAIPQRSRLSVWWNGIVTGITPVSNGCLWITGAWMRLGRGRQIAISTQAWRGSKAKVRMYKKKSMWCTRSASREEGVRIGQKCRKMRWTIGPFKTQQHHGRNSAGNATHKYAMSILNKGRSRFTDGHWLFLLEVAKMDNRVSEVESAPWITELDILRINLLTEQRKVS